MMNHTEPLQRLKAHLRAQAKEENIDLANPENRFTLWVRNGQQGFLCKGSASYPYEVHRRLGHFMMIDNAAILEANQDGDTVTLFRSEVG